MARIEAIQAECKEHKEGIKALRLMFTVGTVQFHPAIKIEMEEGFMDFRTPDENKLMFTVRANAFIGAELGESLAPVQTSPILLPQIVPKQK